MERTAIASQPPGKRRACGAKNRAGFPCSRAPVPGSKRCNLHGGKKFTPGDYRNGGAKPTTYLYRRHLDTAGQEAFDAATIDSIDAEIKLAKANLDAAVQAWNQCADPTKAEIRKGRLWVDVIRDHVDTVGRLLKVRARIFGEEGHLQARGAIRDLMDQLQAAKDADE